MKKIGVCMSGGGARGVAHIGVLKALEEHNLKIEMLSGASAGAIIAILRGSGKSADEILAVIKNVNFLKLFRPSLNWKSLLKLENVIPVLQEHIKEDSFEHLQIPTIVSATDLEKGKPKYFKKGKLFKPVVASCSIPVVFNPVTISGRQYIDGGVLDNLPVKPLKRKVDYIIGVHVNPIQANFNPSSWRELLERSLLMAISASTYQQKKKCDLFLEPPKLANYKVFDYKKFDEIFEIGYEYAMEKIDESVLNELNLIEENSH